MYNSHIFNFRNTTIKVTKRSTINDQLKHSKYTLVFPQSLRKAVFYINHMYSKRCHCNVSKLSITKLHVLSPNLAYENACSYIILYRKYTRTLSTLL